MSLVEAYESVYFRLDVKLEKERRTVSTDHVEFM